MMKFLISFVLVLVVIASQLSMHTCLVGKQIRILHVDHSAGTSGYDLCGCKHLFIRVQTAAIRWTLCLNFCYKAYYSLLTM